MQEVFILSAARTPMGGFGGNLSSLSATTLGSLAIKGALSKIGLSHDTHFDEVLMGNVLSANLGQAPARQAALDSGIQVSTPCTTINKVCASGMKAVMLGAQSIMCGQTNLLIAGGMESMSNTPYYLPKARFGYKFGHGNLIDGLSKDGLQEVYHDFPMGNCADHTAREMNISRAAQDNYAANSYRRAAEAWEKGRFTAEVIPANIKDHKGKELLIDKDEDYLKVIMDKIPQLKPVFEKDGTVTAANSSTISDGAAALILGSREMAENLDLKPIARIRGFADAARDPMWFTTAPALAIPKALKQAGMDITDVDYFEINEAFAVVALANQRLLNIPEEKLNIYGGAIALGHPLGCSGARILTTLLSVLHQENGKLGVAGICNGGGGASAMVVEKI